MITIDPTCGESKKRSSVSKSAKEFFNDLPHRFYYYQDFKQSMPSPAVVFHQDGKTIAFNCEPGDSKHMGVLIKKFMIVEEKSVFSDKERMTLYRKRRINI